MRRFAVYLLLALLIAGCDGSSGDNANSSSGANASGKAAASSDVAGLRTVAIDSNEGEVEVQVEIADSPEEQARGLMDRTALGEDRGMLFVFPEEDERSFWMRNTLIPLSIAYLDSEGRIVDIQDMKALDDVPPHYVSAEPARYALEVNRGFFEERGVEVGDRAELPG